MKNKDHYKRQLPQELHEKIMKLTTCRTDYLILEHLVGNAIAENDVVGWINPREFCEHLSVNRSYVSFIMRGFVERGVIIPKWREVRGYFEIRMLKKN